VRRSALDFYGHFTGHSSYPTVCRALLEWLRQHELEVAPVDVRQSDGRTELPKRHEAALVFAFPSWYGVIPRHSVTFGYHVCDRTPPLEWYGWVKKRVDVLLTPSRWSARCLQDLGLHGAHVVRHGIDPDVFRPDGPKDRSGLRSGEKLVRHYGSSPGTRKRTQVVYMSARLLSIMIGRPAFDLSVHPESLLEVPGVLGAESPPEGLRLRQETPKEPWQLASELRGADLVVQPSEAEGFGLIPLQAAACGTPVLMTATTGHAEYANDLGDVATFVPSDEAELRAVLPGKLLECCLTPPGEKGAAEGARIGTTARAIREKWAWAAVLDQDLLPVLQRNL